MSGSEWPWWESSWMAEELAQTVWLICLANSLWMNDQDQRAWEYSTQRTSYYFYSLTFGVNMWAMPSTAPFSSKPRTRKQKSTTYGKRELKYITLERKRESSTLQCYHGHAFLRSGLRKKDKNCNQTFHTHTHESNQKLLYVCLALNLWNFTKCGERTRWGLERRVKNPSYSISGNHSSTDYDNWITKFSV